MEHVFVVDYSNNKYPTLCCTLYKQYVRKYYVMYDITNKLNKDKFY